MKKIISIIAAVSMALPVTAAHAKVGDVIGEALNTDIVAYINHYAIPSYAVNGTSCVVAEDLRNFGFDVTWNNDTRSLTIARNDSAYATEMNFSKDAPPASKFADLLETDISVYADDVKLTSYAMNGYTMIPIEELTMFGECYWIAEERALKLWVDGLTMRSEKQAITSYEEIQAAVAAAAAKEANIENLVVLGLKSYKSSMKDPSSFKLNSVYAGYYTFSQYSYDFAIVADISGKNSYGATVRNETIIAINTSANTVIHDFLGYAENKSKGLVGTSYLNSLDFQKELLKLKYYKNDLLKWLNANSIENKVNN